MWLSGLNRDRAKGRLAHHPHLRRLGRRTYAMSHARGLRVEPSSKLIRLRISVFGRPRAELHENGAATFRQHLQLVEAHALRAQRIDDLPVEAFETDRLVGQ